MGLGTLFVLIIGMGMLAYFENKDTQQQYKQVLINDEEVRYGLKSIQYRVTGISNDERGYLLTGNMDFTKGLQEKKQEISSYLSKIKKKNLNIQDQKMLEVVEKEIQAFLNMGDKVRSTYEGNPKQALQLHLHEERDIRKKQMEPAVNKLITSIDEKTISDIAAVERNNQFTNLFILILIGIEIFIGAAISVLLWKSLKPLNQLQINFQAVADGDLTETIEVKTRDEIGALETSINKMIETLRMTISVIGESSSQVAASADELTASSEQSTRNSEQISQLFQQFSLSTEQQLVKFLDLAKVIGELSNGIQQVHENGEAMSNLSETAKDAAEQGHQGIKAVVSEMNTISNSVDETSQIIHGLGEKSVKIENIVKIISDLAEQTNLLALNAAIEAARAGEHGKGFAIVADEVRKLAEESKTSANNVREVLAEIQHETEAAVDSMENGLQKVQLGIHSTYHVNGTFQTIETSISQLSKKVEEVLQYVREMNHLNKKVVMFVKEVKELAEKNTVATQESIATSQEQLATAEEIFSSADILSKLADKLQTLITRFKL